MAACELSASGSAFGTFLSAFIGSILNGLFNGFYVAFLTGWIAWLSVTRILAAGIYEGYLVATKPLDQDDYTSVHLQPLVQGASAADDTEYHGATAAPAPAYLQNNTNNSNNGFAPQQHQSTTTASHGAPPPPPYQPEKPQTNPSSIRNTLSPRMRPPHRLTPQREVNWKGWLGWCWSALYTPVSQTIWVAINGPNPNNATVKLVRALAIGVSALGLTFDTRRRYAAALARRTGRPWAGTLFAAWSALMCVLLGAEALSLLIVGAVQLVSRGQLPVFVPFVYAFFTCVWAWVSWRFLPPADGSRAGINIVADALMGVFAGIFVAAPALVLWRDRVWDERAAGIMGAQASGGQDLAAYLGCEGGSVLGKFAAIMP